MHVFRLTPYHSGELPMSRSIIIPAGDIDTVSTAIASVHKHPDPARSTKAQQTGLKDMSTKKGRLTVRSGLPSSRADILAHQNGGIPARWVKGAESALASN